jgi:xylulokinase
MPSSFAVLRLTGEYVLDHHSASQCDPLYDLRGGTWIDEWWQSVAGDLPKPRLLWPAEVAGEVTPAAAEETGIPAGTPVCAGTIDAWAESLAAGVTEPGALMIMYGSTIFLIQCVTSPAPSPALWATAGVEPGTFSIAAGMATGGLAVTWLREVLGEPAWGDFVDRAAAVPPGARGLLFLPYLAGERTPIFDPDARGLIVGLTLGHGPPELARAAFEGIAFAVRHNIEAMASVGAPATRIVGVGGGTRTGVLPQVVTDVLGREQSICHPSVGASFGSAMLAARAVSLTDSVGDWPRIERGLEPDASAAGTYADLFARYCDLYLRTADDMHALARLGTA